MSIRAMNWAMSSRCDGVSAQCVLLVVADTANEHGVSVHADPDYIAERTRQSRATVFRRLRELETVGALTRLKRFKEDGGATYEIRLNLAAAVDYDKPPANDDDTQDVEGESQIETGGESQIETASISPVRLAESHSCDSHMSPSKSPKKEPPNPPRGAVEVIPDQDLERDLTEAQRVYPAPITNLPRLRSVMAAMAPPERQRVLTAMRGYATFIADCERKKRPRAVKDADRWVASGMWQGFVTGGEKTEAAALVQFVAVDSPEGRALAILHKIAGLSPPAVFNGTYRLVRPFDAQGLAFADVPEEAQWTFVPEDATNQVGAWRRLLGDILQKPLGLLIRDRVWRGREKISQRGFIVPWPWPPRKDGTLSPTGPPQTLMTEADERELENFR